MPLTSHVGTVAGGLHHLAPPASFLTFLFGLVVDFLCLPNKTSRVQHCAAGEANGTAPRAHVVGVIERRAFASEAIEVGSLNLFIAKFRDGIKAKVICENEDDVGAIIRERLSSGEVEEKRA